MPKLTTHISVSEPSASFYEHDEDLCRELGIPSFREHQKKAVDAIRNGTDVLAVSPTGSGKTEALWASGLVMGGLTVIVSPLRSLMADQVRRCKGLMLEVDLWNSDVPECEKEGFLRRLRVGRPEARFLYTTPESLKSERLFNALKGKVRLAVVDEAHCALRDRGFRADFGRLGQVLDGINPALRYACTATLPKSDRPLLIDALGLRDPVEIVSPISRSNLKFNLIPRDHYSLWPVLQHHRGETGIVFCATVATAESLHALLESQGYSVCLYHGKLKQKERSGAQGSFMAGERKIAIVTDAFLLGIDKPDIRFIVHWDLPKSTEDWAQGFGRAGRDGDESQIYGCFIHNDESKRTRRFLLDSSYPQVRSAEAVWSALSCDRWNGDPFGLICERAIGRAGKYCSHGISTILKRYNLMESRRVNKDDNIANARMLYKRTGVFDSVNWDEYDAERTSVFERFDALIGLVRAGVGGITERIDDYFERS